MHPIVCTMVDSSLSSPMICQCTDTVCSGWGDKAAVGNQPESEAEKCRGEPSRQWK